MDQGGFSWTNPDVQPVQQPPSGPSRRQIGMVAIVTLAIFAGLIAFTVLGANNGGKGGALNPIAQAAEKTADFPGERMSMSMSFSAPVPIELHGSGAFNGKTQRGKFDLTMEGPEPIGTFDVNEVIDGTDLYIGSPELTGSLPGGKAWLRVDPFSDDASSSAFGQSDPRQQLEELKSVSDAVGSVGAESIGGHPTTHYSAVIGIDKFIEGMRESDDESADKLEDLAGRIGLQDVPVQVWIDRRSLLRRMTMVLPVGEVQGQQVSMTLNMDFFDYGATPSIQVPSPDQVYDARGVDLDSLTG